jgi:hypothetical protein
MTATIRVTPSYTFVMAASDFKHPVATVDGKEYQMAWGKPTDIAVAAGRSYQLHVDLRAFGLHWCRGTIHTGVLKEGETAAFEYQINVVDRVVGGAHLRRVQGSV